MPYMNQLGIKFTLAALVLSGCAAPSILGAPLAPQPNRFQMRQLYTPNPQFRRTNSPQVMKLKANAAILNTRSQQPISATPNQLIFQGEAPYSPGQILMGRTEDGQDYLRRVVNVEAGAAGTVLYTERANLFETFDELDVSHTDLEASRPIELDRRSFKIGFIDVTSRLTATPDFSDTRLRLQNGQALFVRLAPELKMRWEVTTATSFSTMMGDDMNPEANMRPIGSVNFKNFVIPTSIGGVPVTFYIRPGAALDWGHSGSGHVELSGELNGSVKAGVELTATLDDYPDVNTVYDHSFGGKINPPKLEFNGKINTRVHIPRIRVESKIADMIGPYVEAESYLDGELTARMNSQGSKVQVNGHAAVHLGLGLKAGLPKTDLFGKTITEEIHKTLFNRRVKTLYDQRVSYTLP